MTGQHFVRALPLGGRRHRHPPTGRTSPTGASATNACRAENPGLIYLRISPFGDDGPWASYAASDLVHLALGGVMMNCGYDPTPEGTYDTPPVAPQMWQSYQIAGEVSAIAVMGALQYRLDTGRGQRLSTAVHEAVAKNTETDAPELGVLGARAPPRHLPALVPGEQAGPTRRAARCRASR